MLTRTPKVAKTLKGTVRIEDWVKAGRATPFLEGFVSMELGETEDGADFYLTLRDEATSFEEEYPFTAEQVELLTKNLGKALASRWSGAAYRHSVCGVCGISRYYAGVIMTECEDRGDRHVWTYKDTTEATEWQKN